MSEAVTAAVLAMIALGLVVTGLSRWRQRADRADPAPLWLMLTTVGGAAPAGAIALLLVTPEGWQWPSVVLVVTMFGWFAIFCAGGPVQELGERRQLREAQVAGLPTLPRRVPPSWIGVGVGFLSLFALVGMLWGALSLLATFSFPPEVVHTLTSPISKRLMVWTLAACAVAIGLCAALWQRHRKQRDQ